MTRPAAGTPPSQDWPPSRKATVPRARSFQGSETRPTGRIFRSINQLARAIAFLITILTIAGCGQDDAYPRRPILLVCPWAAGGGTDRVSRQIAVHLQQELGVPVNVINATGGKGVTGHRRGLCARADGYTITMATVELNMMHWSGLSDLTWHDATPLVSINEDYAALFVRQDAPWQSLQELEAAISDQPGKLKASGTAAGGIWHLALAGWLEAQDRSVDDVVWISSQGAGPSLQELISGGLDMVCCSLPEARSLYAAGEIRSLGVMAPKRAAGFPDVPTFEEQGTPWSLGGWRGLALPQGTPPERVELLANALNAVVDGKTRIVQAGAGVEDEQSFPEFMEIQGFDNTCRRREEFSNFLNEQDDKFGKLLTSNAMQSVSRDPFPPWAFPSLVGGSMAVCLLILGVGKLTRRPATESSPPSDAELEGMEGPAASVEADTSLAGDVANDRGSTQWRGWLNFAAVVASVAIYLVAAESLGFVLTSALLLTCLLILFGNRWWLSLLIAVALSATVYQVFANLLRVPLPQGLLGW